MASEQETLRIAYARALGLRNAAPHQGTTPGLGTDVNDIVQMIQPIVGAIAHSFAIREPYIWRSQDGTYYCDAVVIQGKLAQIVSYLEHLYHINDQILEIGSLYNSIKDTELKSRCADLLSAPGNFDRVINQATLVLEDRIRTKSQIDKPLTGVPLVNAVLNADLTKTVLKISENAEEHEGICHVCRGLMLSFRNPTHHHILDKYSREDALKLCGFIDNILSLIDNATVLARS